MTTMHGSAADEGRIAELPPVSTGSGTTHRVAPIISKNLKLISTKTEKSRTPKTAKLCESPRGAGIVDRRLSLGDLQAPVLDLHGSGMPDRVLATSLRRMGRVATVAAEVGARFARERIDVDPMAWLAAPRRLFDGASAIVAVQNSVHFHRAMVLHGLGLGLDADPDEIDGLLDDEDGIDFHGGADAGAESGTAKDEGATLFTAVVIDVSGRGSLFVFHARIARSRKEFESGLRLRVGAALADAARIDEGYDPRDPVAAALVSRTLDGMLRQAEDDPASPLAAGLDIFVEQRFAD